MNGAPGKMNLGGILDEMIAYTLPNEESYNPSDNCAWDCACYGTEWPEGQSDTSADFCSCTSTNYDTAESAGVLVCLV